MSTTPTPTPAPTLSTGQQAAIALLARISPRLTETEQAIIATAMAFSMPAGQNPLQETFTALQGVTNAFAQDPNPTVQTDAAIAGIFSALIGQAVEGVEAATTPAVIVPNAHPGFILTLFHHNIANQEKALAAAQAQVANAPKPALFPAPVVVKP